MARFEQRYVVQADDVNFLRHVGNAQWLAILERARVEMLARFNVRLLELLDRGLGIVVSAAHVYFLRPATIGDELRIAIHTSNPAANGVVLHYRVRNRRDEPVLRAELAMVFVDASGHPTAMPDDVRAVLFDEGVE